MKYLLTIFLLLAPTMALAQQQYDLSGTARTSLYGKYRYPGDTSATMDASGNLNINCIIGCSALSSPLPAGSNTIGAVTQDGAPWSVSGTVAATQGTSPWVTSGTVTANQGGAPWSVSQSGAPWSVSGTVSAAQSGTWSVLTTATPQLPSTAFPGPSMAITDGSHYAGVTAPYTPAASWQSAQVMALTPSSPLPAGTNTIGAVSQSGAPWSVSQSGSPWGISGTVGATQSGTWTMTPATTNTPVQINNSANQELATMVNPLRIVQTLTSPLAGNATLFLSVNSNGQSEDAYGNLRVASMPTDGRNFAGITAPGAAAQAWQGAEVVALSPNTSLPAGTNTLGTVTANQGSPPWSTTLRNSTNQTLGANYTPLFMTQTVSPVHGLTLMFGFPDPGFGNLDSYGNIRGASMVTDGFNYAGVTAPNKPTRYDQGAAVVNLSPNPSLQCSYVKSVSLTASAIVLAGTAGRFNHICAFNVYNTTSQTVALVEGTGTACGTSQTSLYGSATVGAGAGIQIGTDRITIPMQKAGDDLCILTGSSTAVAGIIVYGSFAQ